jgi:hypothetical protein
MEFWSVNGHSQIPKPSQIFKEIITYLYIIIPSCLHVIRYQMYLIFLANL